MAIFDQLAPIRRVWLLSDFTQSWHEAGHETSCGSILLRLRERKKGAPKGAP